MLYPKRLMLLWLSASQALPCIACACQVICIRMQAVKLCHGVYSIMILVVCFVHGHLPALLASIQSDIIEGS